MHTSDCCNSHDTVVKVVCTVVPVMMIRRICSRSCPLVLKRKATCFCSVPSKGSFLLQPSCLSFIVPLLSVHFQLCAIAKSTGGLQGLLHVKCCCAVKLPSFTGV